VDRNEPLAAKATEEIVNDRLKAAQADYGVKETLQIEWRGAAKSLPVITMPLNLLLYNPDTHRVKAQRDFDQERDAAIDSDPWSIEAQQYLDYLLGALPNDPSKVDPAFEKLRDDLETYAQKEPGIITPSGILINGNSRCAALRKGNTLQMRVAVLPSDWTWTDVTSVELELQMRKDYRRDYSFVNTLLALDEAIGDVGPDSAMKAFRMAKTAFNRSVWILQAIRELTERSKQPDGATLNLRDFENDQGKLEELYRTYSATSRSDPEAADVLRESRLLALLMEKSKTDMRLVTDRFIPDYLNRQLGGSSFDFDPEVPEQDIPGLGRGLPVASPTLQKAKSLVDVIARLRAEMTSSNEEVRARAATKYRDFETRIESALDAAGKSQRLKKVQQAAIDKINDAADSIEGAVLEVADAKSKQALDEASLDEAITNLRRSLSIFASSVARMASLPAESAEWLDALRAIKDD
jgi:hypothetical protein